MHLVTLVVVVGASIVVSRSFAQEQNSASSLEYDRDVKRSYLERLIRNRDMVFVRRSLNNLWKRMTPEERLQLLQRYPPVNQNPDEVTTLSPTDNQQQQRPVMAAAAVLTNQQQQQQQPSPQIFAPTNQQQQQPSPQMNLLANVLKLVAANFLGSSGAGGGGGLTSSVVQPPAVVAPPPPAPPPPPPEQPNPGDNLLGSLMTGRLGQIDWIGSLLGTKDQFGAQEGNALAQLFQGSGLFG